MDSVYFQQIQCPYCGEQIDMEVDVSGGEQSYIEDCSVCCRPIEVHLVQLGEDWQLQLRRDDD